MSLKRLAVQQFRNLVDVDFVPSDGVNLFFGENGSGKTSVLEAIAVLGLGRSFRSHKHKPLIRHQHSSFTVFGRLHTEGADVPLGVSRSLIGEASFKANGVLVTSAAALAAYLPLQVINSDTFLLLDGTPNTRRQFIDWLVFHVEPTFFQVWKDVQRCLKHRNSLLRRDRIDRFELSIWDQELVLLTERIHALRDACMRRFFESFFPLLEEILVVEGLKLTYHRGWDGDTSYADALAASYDRDIRQGFTHVGSHRADLRITLNGQGAAEILSRGQQKLLVCALKIAQGYVFSTITGRKCIYLVDDLPAELDEGHRALLVSWLTKMETQVFVTGVEKEPLVDSWKNSSSMDMKLFHVEHGKVSQRLLNE